MVAFFKYRRKSGAVQSTLEEYFVIGIHNLINVSMYVAVTLFNFKFNKNVGLYLFQNHITSKWNVSQNAVAYTFPNVAALLTISFYCRCIYRERWAATVVLKYLCCPKTSWSKFPSKCFWYHEIVVYVHNTTKPIVYVHVHDNLLCTYSIRGIYV